MKTEWNNRDYQFDSNGGNGRGSFQVHNQHMKAFRLAHPNNWRQWGHTVPKVQEGPSAPIVTVPLQRVLPVSRYWQN